MVGHDPTIQPQAAMGPRAKPEDDGRNPGGEAQDEDFKGRGIPS